ncbi:MAG: hypothetical protein FD165_2594 [Gammaproteobacteria bacterium]|nr:MAG: hypothetical protein FD165_2594 [Gammaproteobacteria bacterium]TND04069.1 MAG: hypothetical protein FD120_1778 [Gammaproteobacteria bacterium]
MIPRSYIYRLFGASPVRPLQKHMAKVFACVSELAPLFESVFARDFDKVAQCQQNILTMEHEADAMKKALRQKLPTGLFLPVSRRDLLEVLTMQDRIANTAKDIAGLILGRKMMIPAIMEERFMAFVRRNIDATAQAQKAIDEFDELIETGFRGGEVALVEGMIRTLDEIESETDALQVEVRHILLAMEKELPPIDVMFLYNIIDWVGDVGDTAQRVGSRLQLMLAS